MPDRMTATARLHSSLLPETLLRASTIEFYATRWGPLDEAEVRADPWKVLHLLPSTDKRTYRTGGHGVLLPGAIADSVVHSTGTTGNPLLRYRSRDEVAAHQRLTDGRRRAGRALLFNCLAGFVHGGRSGFRAADVEMQLNTASELSLQRAIDVLVREDLLPGQGPLQRVLAGTPFDLALLTAAMLDRFGSTATAGLDILVNLTDVLPQPSYDFLTRAWAPSRVVNRFSISEIVGGATQLADGSLRFDPTVVAETLALDSDEQVVDGVAELTLTELFPFSQIQPFVRYRTGDLVRVEPAQDGGSTIRLLGRLALTPVLHRPSTRILLGMIGLRSRLDGLPELAREEMPGHVPGAAGLGQVLGDWRLDAEGARPRFRLRVALTASRYLFPSVAKDVRARVETHVRAEIAAVGAADAADVTVELVPAADLQMLGSRPSVWTDQADRSERHASPSPPAPASPASAGDRGGRHDAGAPAESGIPGVTTEMLPSAATGRAESLR